MNRREIFEKVKKHLLTQNEKSFTLSKGCAYRDGEGRKCAIGVLITDECYKPYLEGRSADAKVVIEALECSGLKIKEGDGDFLSKLQGIHDAKPPSLWPKALAVFAMEYNL